MRTYHVTYTPHVPRILALGLLLRQPHNWHNPAGEPMGGGAIFAFEAEADAIRWAARMEWEQPSSRRQPGRISILTLETGPVWDTDFADPLSQVGKAGRWLKTFQPVPAGAIVAHQRLTAKMIIRAVQEFNAVWTAAALEGGAQ